MHFHESQNHISLFLSTVFLREWVRGWGSPPPPREPDSSTKVADRRRQPEARLPRKEPEKPELDPTGETGARSRPKGRAQLTLRVRQRAGFSDNHRLFMSSRDQKCYQRDIFDPSNCSNSSFFSFRLDFDFCVWKISHVSNQTSVTDWCGRKNFRKTSQFEKQWYKLFWMISRLWCWQSSCWW